MFPIFNGRLLARLFLFGIAISSMLSFAGISAERLSFVPCIFRFITGIPCPGCGMTHACISFAKMDIEQAWGFHPFVFLLMPLAVCVAFFPSVIDIWKKLPSQTQQICVIFGIFAVIALWAYRFFFTSIFNNF